MSIKYDHFIIAWSDKMRLVCLLIIAVISMMLCPSIPRCQEPGATSSLSITFGSYGVGRIYAPVRFGEVNRLMRIDTGASTSHIKLAPWNKKLPSLGQRHTLTVTGNKSLCDKVRFHDVEIIGHESQKVRKENYQLLRCLTSNGDDLLGIDFFQGEYFTLNFKDKQINFINNLDQTLQSTPFRKITGADGLLGVDIKIGSSASVGLFDSGAEISAVDQRFVAQNKSSFVLVRNTGMATEASGKQWPTKLYQIKSLDIGRGQVVRDIYAIVYDFGVLHEAFGRETSFILGFNFISKFNWMIDLRSSQDPRWTARLR